MAILSLISYGVIIISAVAMCLGWNCRHFWPLAASYVIGISFLSTILSMSMTSADHNLAGEVYNPDVSVIFENFLAKFILFSLEFYGPWWLRRWLKPHAEIPDINNEVS